VSPREFMHYQLAPLRFKMSAEVCHGPGTSVIEQMI